MPLYRLPRRTYGVYWDVLSPAGWQQRTAELAAEQDRKRKLDAATVAFAQPGEMQPERDFNFQGAESYPIREAGRAGRVGRDWFSFELPVDAAKPMALVVTYRSGERPREPKFEILIDGERIAEQTLEKTSPARFYDTRYPIPEKVTAGKAKVTVRFQTSEGNGIGPIFGIRTMAADAE